MYKKLVFVAFIFLFLSLSTINVTASSISLADDVELKVYGKLFGVVFEVQNYRNESIDINITIDITKLRGYYELDAGVFCLSQALTTHDVDFIFLFFGKIKVTASFEDIYIEKNGFILFGYWFLR